MLLEVLVVWLVVSPVVGVGLGLLIARAGQLADRRELPEAAAVTAAVPQLVAPAQAPRPATVADVPGPRPAPSHDDVLHLRLTGPEL